MKKLIPLQSLYYLTLFAVVAVPLASIITIRGTDVWYSQYVMMMSVFFFGISLVLWKFNKYMSIFTMVCLYSVVFKMNQHPAAFQVLFQIDMACLAIYVISKFKGTQCFVIVIIIIGMVLIQGTMVCLQFINADPIFNSIKDVALDDTVGFAGSHNQLGLFFATSAPIIVEIAPLLIPLVIVGLCGSTTSVAWIAFIVSSLFTLLFIKDSFRERRYMAVICASLVIGSIIFFMIDRPSSQKYAERYGLYKHTIESVLTGHTTGRIYKDGAIFQKVIKCNPFTGYGLSSFIKISPYTQYEFLTEIRNRFKQPEHETHVFSHAHNDYLEVLHDLGIIGFVSLMAMILNFLYRCYDTIRYRKYETLFIISFASVLAYMICAMGIFAVHTATSGILLVIYVGICEGEMRRAKWGE